MNNSKSTLINSTSENRNNLHNVVLTMYKLAFISFLFFLTNCSYLTSVELFLRYLPLKIKFNIHLSISKLFIEFSHLLEIFVTFYLPFFYVSFRTWHTSRSRVFVNTYNVNAKWYMKLYHSSIHSNATFKFHNIQLTWKLKWKVCKHYTAFHS